MAHTLTRISQLVLEELGRGEMRLLVLTVAVRKALNRSEGIKCDLPAAVQSTLRRLVASKSVVDVDGVYALAPAA